MLNRRYLRVKVFQQLYSFFITPESDKNRSELELFKSLEKIYDLYLSLLSLLVEIRHSAQLHLEKSKNKHLTTYEDRHPKTRFVDNRVIAAIANNSRFKRHIENKKIQWTNEIDFPAKFFKIIRLSPEFSAYMNAPEDNFIHDKNFLVEIYKNNIFNSEELHSYFEEKNIHWEDDITLANLSVIKTLEQLNQADSAEQSILMPLYKDEAEDSEFARSLFRKTIIYDKEFNALISEKAANWEMERIAVADMILMKMALCELLHFENIPVKVSLNEYIEISKDYSTPQSKIFINGILDKIVTDLKASGKINKKGRGLME